MQFPQHLPIRLSNSKLAAGKQSTSLCKPDATLQEAITLMMSHDFSQLPRHATEQRCQGSHRLDTYMVVGRPRKKSNVSGTSWIRIKRSDPSHRLSKLGSLVQNQ